MKICFAALAQDRKTAYDTSRNIEQRKPRKECELVILLLEIQFTCISLNLVTPSPFC
jgi:hypothetical protein